MFRAYFGLTVASFRLSLTWNFVINDFIGGYLNAARFGKDKLKQQYNDPAKQDLTHWADNFAALNELPTDLADIMDEFGKSEHNFHLFPFNANAIERLATRSF